MFLIIEMFSHICVFCFRVKITVMCIKINQYIILLKIQFISSNVLFLTQFGYCVQNELQIFLSCVCT